MYWYNENGYDYFKPDTVLPTCNFDSIFFNQNSVPDINSNTLKIYPNPASEKITVTFDNLMVKNLKANIYDSKGCLIKTESMFGNEINIKNLNQGLYFLIIESEGKSYFNKFTKE